MFHVLITVNLVLPHPGYLVTYLGDCTLGKWEYPDIQGLLDIASELIPGDHKYHHGSLLDWRHKETS